MKSESAIVHFNENGTPVADDFDDVYFSNDSGIAETRHVFMAGNDLPCRWQNHDRADFVIAETGFGTGLNCLVAMHAFAQFRHHNPHHILRHLFILTTEKYPLKQTDLSVALSRFEELNDGISVLLSHYPPPLNGCHRLHFNQFSTTLDLWIGDVHDLLPQWHCPPTGLVDAWFLDGFAPSKNPQMWTDALFNQMSRLSRPTATFSTFTAAGVVKRGLKSAGFDISKRAGFGRKRDMLTGQYRAEACEPPRSPYFRYNSPALHKNDEVAIVGGGIAAATLAHRLASQGIKSSILCADEALASGASGNPIGGFYPQLHAEASHPSRLQALSFLYARQLYDALDAHFSHDWCGVLQLSFSKQVLARHQNLIAKQIWPDTLIKPVSKQEARELANLDLPSGGLFIERGGWLSPPELVSALIDDVSPHVTLRLNNRVTQIDEHENSVTLYVNGVAETYTRVIIATGADSITLPHMHALPLRPVRGQVEAIPTQSPISGLKTVLCHKGYMTPAMAHRHALGSTYSKDDTKSDVRAEDSNANLATHEKALYGATWVFALAHDGKARASIRLTLPDHQPATGQLSAKAQIRERYPALAKGKAVDTQPPLPPSNIYTLTGLGSRGLTTAPLMAELLACELTHRPLPLPTNLLQAVSPSRFTLRDMIRGKLTD